MRKAGEAIRIGRCVTVGCESSRGYGDNPAGVITDLSPGVTVDRIGVINRPANYDLEFCCKRKKCLHSVIVISPAAWFLCCTVYTIESTAG